MISQVGAEWYTTCFIPHTADSGLSLINTKTLLLVINDSRLGLPRVCTGYLSFEAFIDAVNDIKAGRATPADFDGSLATIGTTAMTTAMLEAGRLSLDANGRPFDILYAEETVSGHPMPVDIRPTTF